MALTHKAASEYCVPSEVSAHTKNKTFWRLLQNFKDLILILILVEDTTRNPKAKKFVLHLLRGQNDKLIFNKVKTGLEFMHTHTHRLLLISRKQECKFAWH